ncbi:MAG TPA: ATP-binding protein [Desulfobacteria bacterium]|nr:ATP-binding protein [Desulfobacteria bacterium]
MIEKVHVSNFKCIKAQTLDSLTPIVGIWGRNGSGKSSLLQAIMWVSKNKGSGNANGINLKDPSNFIFGHDGGRLPIHYQQ